MKEIKSDPDLILDGLYYRQGLIPETSLRFAKESGIDQVITTPEKIGVIYKINESDYGINSGYSMHVGNFKKFVEELERLADQRAYAMSRPKFRGCHTAKADKVHASIDKDSRKRFKEESVFFAKYGNAWKALATEREGAYYSCMELLPASNNELQLFRGFVQAYLKFNLINRVRPYILPPEKRALQPSEKIFINKKRRTEKKRERKSSRTLAYKITDIRSYSTNEEENKMPTIARAIRRHPQR